MLGWSEAVLDWSEAVLDWSDAVLDWSEAVLVCTVLVSGLGAPVEKCRNTLLHLTVFIACQSC